MKANETKFEDFLASNKTQFIIPVYQRNYDWTMSQCKQLLDDILEVSSNNKMNAHFIGSVVYIHDDVYTSSRIKELTIIDGQQRLTTITLLYIVLYRMAKKLKNEKLMNEINETYLINKYSLEEEKLKLRPTENNDRALKYLLRSDEQEDYQDFSRLIENYKYFKGRITEENYQTILKGLSKLMFVEISLDREKDAPQRIFESLNSTGLDLSQADLIRNYILMGLKRDDQAKIYHDYWEIIELYAKDEKTNESRVSDFIRDYLTLENKNIPNKNKVYQEFKAKYPTTTLDNLLTVLTILKALAMYYNKLINPQKETDREISLQLQYISRLEMNVAYPFLMKVYADYGEHVIDKAAFINIFELVQSFVWRRFVMGFETAGRNKIFMNLYDKIDKPNYLFSIQKAFLKLTGNSRFPKDAETINALKEKDVYNIKSKNRSYLLDRLENFENREIVIIDTNPDITVEHIFPQNPDSKWKLELKQDEFSFIRDNYLNTIGNLTLSGNNGELGNKPFLEKRDLLNAGYKDSRLWLNKHLSTLGKWGRNEIEERFRQISERFLKIWKFPEIDLTNDTEAPETNIFEAEEPKSKKLEYAIFLDQKIEVKEVAKLYGEVFRQLFELQPETFFKTDLGAKIGLTESPVPGNPRQPLAINDSYFIEGNLDNNGKFVRLKYALTLFRLEDELSIKYAGD